MITIVFEILMLLSIIIPIYFQRVLVHFIGNLMGYNFYSNNSVQKQLQSAGVFSLGSKLNNLGESIQKEVHGSLLPVYAIELKQKMKNGVGGLTTVTYYGKKTRSFIIQDGHRSACYGVVEGTQCKGNLQQHTFTSDEDFCYADSYAVVNDRICLSSGSINVQVYNNNVMCTGNNGAKTLVLSKAEYNQLCGENLRAVFVYYSDSHNPQTVPIPNPNPYVSCLNKQPGVCVFEDTEQINAENTVSTQDSYYYGSN
ncbi:hypothetical protein RI129_002125 [Pyrocoelia pectoralis]|uniref:Uncharacterized protein n=1 Tax=Pyrocoelia pectoralis TaxID=417401 RepID=A0AAN7VL56_9COLE